MSLKNTTTLGKTTFIFSIIMLINTILTFSLHFISYKYTQGILFYFIEGMILLSIPILGFANFFLVIITFFQRRSDKVLSFIALIITLPITSMFVVCFLAFGV